MISYRHDHQQVAITCALNSAGAHNNGKSIWLLWVSEASSIYSYSCTNQTWSFSLLHGVNNGLLLCIDQDRTRNHPSPSRPLASTRLNSPIARWKEPFNGLSSVVACVLRWATRACSLIGWLSGPIWDKRGKELTTDLISALAELQRHDGHGARTQIILLAESYDGCGGRGIVLNRAKSPRSYWPKTGAIICTRNLGLNFLTGYTGWGKIIECGMCKNAENQQVW